jgi:hypothetical protein
MRTSCHRDRLLLILDEFACFGHPAIVVRTDKDLRLWPVQQQAPMLET